MKGVSPLFCIMRFFFSKKEKLASEKEIEQLFNGGISNFIYPIRVLFDISSSKQNECKVLISAPKRFLKTAVERNLVKRRIRESYRLNVSDLKKKIFEANVSVNIAFIYGSTKIVSYKTIDTIISKHLASIISKIEKGENKR